MRRSFWLSVSVLLAILYLSCSDNNSDEDVNLAPVIEIVTPESDLEIILGSNLYVLAEASDLDGQIDSVYFEFNGQNVAQVSSIPYEFTIDTDLYDIGTYELKVIASDNLGKLTESEVVLIDIYELGPPTPVITLNSPTFIGLFSAKISTNVLGYGLVSEWGICWNTSGQPVKDENLQNYLISDDSYPNDDTYNITNLERNTEYYFRGYIIDNQSNIIYSEEEFQVQTASDFYSETGTFTDERDGQEYLWVKINEQTWMAENLRYADCLSDYDYDDAIDQENYGKLGCYSCPDGWRIPTNNDYQSLFDYLGGNETAAKYLKSDDSFFWDPTYATNESLFSA
ncbi:FISUMP domain-containing protein [Winogradskyella forsetii]|uniref:FISUMP domain-containing protein n=1 Tax=Winogradskyella forsetii TaxID=2686077 RepID=UPI0015B9A975|nr:FISUMP domain-containing protein [Winogradskyella forsetii]